MYKASLESVDLIKLLASSTTITNDDIETIDRNVKHLQHILEQDYWTNEDLTPFEEAIKLGLTIQPKKPKYTSPFVGEVPIPTMKGMI